MDKKKSTIINETSEFMMCEDENQLRLYGYIKISDCYWTKIYEKDGHRVVLNREF